MSIRYGRLVNFSSKTVYIESANQPLTILKYQQYLLQFWMVWINIDNI